MGFMVGTSTNSDARTNPETLISNMDHHFSLPRYSSLRFLDKTRNNNNQDNIKELRLDRYTPLPHGDGHTPNQPNMGTPYTP